MVTGGNKPFDATASALSEVQSVTYVSGSDRWEMAEREGFEPPIGLHLCRISSAVHSTTLPPLRAPIRVIPRPAVGRSSRRGRRARQGAGARFPTRVWTAKRSREMEHLTVRANGAAFHVA